VRTKSILSATNVPIIGGHHDQRRFLAARLARLAGGRRGVGGERHTALPHCASIDRQAPLSHRFSFRLQDSHYVNWPTAGQTLTTLLHLEAQPCWVRLVYFNDQDMPWTVDGAALAVSAAVGDGHHRSTPSVSPTLRCGSE
jgi:hypothetical protein